MAMRLAIIFRLRSEKPRRSSDGRSTALIGIAPMIVPSISRPSGCERTAVTSIRSVLSGVKNFMPSPRQPVEVDFQITADFDGRRTAAPRNATRRMHESAGKVEPLDSWYGVLGEF